MATKRKTSKAKAPKLSASIKAEAKKYGVKISRMVGGKRKEKTEAMLRKQIASAKKRAMKATAPKKVTASKPTATPTASKRKKPTKKLKVGQCGGKLRTSRLTGGYKIVGRKRRLKAKK